MLDYAESSSMKFLDSLEDKEILLKDQVEKAQTSLHLIQAAQSCQD